VPINLEGEMKMASIALPKRLGLLLLGIWLIVTGLRQTGWVNISFNGSEIILGIFAIIAGIVIILDR
jgi:uncharacterized membrane protein HdeD (DUF308 family)